MENPGAMSCMEACPYSSFRSVWIFPKSLGVICCDRLVISKGQGFVSHELTAYLSVFDLFLTPLIMATLSNGYKPDNFESHNFHET